MPTAAATTTFTPLHDRIMVRRVEENETVRGGIIINASHVTLKDVTVIGGENGIDVESAEHVRLDGVHVTGVISVGKGKSNDEGKVFPLDVKAGDKILFGKYSGTEIKLDGEEYLIMREEEVLGVIK